MTEEQVSAVEVALGVMVPPAYRRFLLHFPAALFKPAAVEGEGWEWLGPDSGLFHTARSFVEHNRAFREPGSLWLDGQTEPWPAEYLAVGTNGGGDYWCVRTDTAGDRVYRFDHEGGSFADTGRTPEEHAAVLIEMGW